MQNAVQLRSVTWQKCYQLTIRRKDRAAVNIVFRQLNHDVIEGVWVGNIGLFDRLIEIGKVRIILLITFVGLEETLDRGDFGAVSILDLRAFWIHVAHLFMSRRVLRGLAECRRKSLEFKGSRLHHEGNELSAPTKQED